MQTVIRSVAALFFALSLMMLGNGLQGTLVALRSQFENFSDNTTTGFIMAGYFVGFFLGSWLAPKLVAQVGHVRVFGSMAALASLAVLIYPMAVDPYVWIGMRVLTGICYAGLYIVCESWLNERSTNETRGQILSIYMLITLFGMGGGQLLVGLGHPLGYKLFTLVSILISLAAVPVLLSASPVPDFEAPETVRVRKLYHVSPLGVVGVFLNGICSGVMLGMAPSFALETVGLDNAPYFMSLIFVGGFLMTWPLGKLSDRFDRRAVILATAAMGALVSLVGIMLTNSGSTFVLLGLALFAGGFFFPLYSLLIAHTNDYLAPKQMVAASGTLVLITGVGAMLGPNFAGLLMDLMGAPGFFAANAVLLLLLVLFALWRMASRPPLPADEQGQFVAIPRTSPMAMALNPDAEPQPESDPLDSVSEATADTETQTAPEATG